MTNSTIHTNTVPVERGSLDTLAAYYQPLVRPLADLNATMMVAWSEPLNLRFRVERDILAVFADWEGQVVLWGPPLGSPLAPAVLHSALDELDDMNGGPGSGRILYVWEDYELWSAIEADPALFLEPQAREYVYSTTELAALSGRAHRGKRKAARRFARRNSPTVVAYDSSLRHACLQVLETWSLHRRPGVADRHREKFDLESRVCRRAFEDDLPLEGVVVFVEERAEAFSVGTGHGGGTFNCMFEKTNLALSGAAAFVFSELARICGDRFEEINAGEDWGVDYLEHSKEAWRPHRVQCSHTLRRRI